MNDFGIKKKRHKLSKLGGGYLDKTQKNSNFFRKTIPFAESL